MAALLLPAPALAQERDEQPPAASEDDAAKFDLLMNRFRQAQGIAPPPGRGAPPPSPAELERQELTRAAGFDRLYGDRAYERIVRLEKNCYSTDGCDKLAAAGVLEGGYKFVDLQNEALAGTVKPRTPPYRRRHEEIKDGIRKSLDQLRPTPESSPRYRREVGAATKPVVVKVFPPEELRGYDWLNAGAKPPGPPREEAPAQRPPQAPSYADQGRRAYDRAAGAAAGLAPSAGPGEPPSEGGPAGARVASRAGGPRRLDQGLAGGGSAGLEAGGAAGWPAAGGAGVPAGSGAGPADFAREPQGEPAVSLPAAAAAARGPAGALLAEARRSLRLGDSKSAVASLLKAVAAEPGNPAPRALLSIAQSRGRDYRAAAVSADAGLRLAPGDSTLLNAKAYALAGLGDFRGALALADQALAREPRDAVAHFNRAVALGGLGDRGGMIEELRTAAALSPRFRPYLETAEGSLDGNLGFLFDDAAGAARPSPPPSAPAAGRRWWLPGTIVAFLAGLALLAPLPGRRKAKAPTPERPARAGPLLLAGHYAVGRQIDSDGLGVVYEGTDRALQRAVAIKRMREEIRLDERSRRRFIAQARVSARLRHENIIDIRDLVEVQGEVYLIFDLHQGPTLGEIIASRGGLPYPQARGWIEQVAAALDYAHRSGVRHGDLKPSNVLIDSGGRARVRDFAIGPAMEEVISRTGSKTSAGVGTPAYMAPEQERGAPRNESDVFALGVCLYEALTGRKPFSGTGSGLLRGKLERDFTPISSLVRGLPANLDRTLSKALEPEPEMRYPSAGAFARDLPA